MNQATKDFRQNIADIFIKALQEKQHNWKKGWNAAELGQIPVNVCTGKPYRGLNRIALYLNAMEKAGMILPGGSVRTEQLSATGVDNRWATFKQIQEKGWRVRKGAKGCKVEYYQPYDFIAKKKITWDEYHKNRKTEGVGLIAKYYVVFNGKDIEGIPNIEDMTKKRVILEDALIEKISAGMRVPIINDGGDRAYYSISSDTIHMPQKEAFADEYEYHSTALHEAGHASGAKHRLNRVQGAYGTEEYAYEELVAEITSVFMMEHFEIPQTDAHVENHKAYIQAWIRQIQNNPDVLIKAIRDASAAADYMEYHAGILTREEYQEATLESMEAPERAIFPDTSKREQEYLVDLSGRLEQNLQTGNWGELKLLLVELSYTAKQAKFDTNHTVVTSQEAVATVGEYTVSLRFTNSYNPQLVGESKKSMKQEIQAVIYKNDTVQKIIEIESKKSSSKKYAAANYEELLEVWKGYTGQSSIKIPVSIEADLRAHGYKATPGLVKKINELNKLVGKTHTVKELCAAFKDRTYQENPEANKLLNSIGKSLQKQELALGNVPVR